MDFYIIFDATLRGSFCDAIMFHIKTAQERRRKRYTPIGRDFMDDILSLTDLTEDTARFTSLKIGFENTEQMVKIGKALSSPERVEIVKYLGNNPSIISKLAEHFGLPLSTAAHHIRVLEAAGLVVVCNIPASRGSQKLCASLITSVVLSFYGSEQERKMSLLFQQSMPIGNYFDYQVVSPCGLISDGVRLSPTDEVSGFCMPNHIQAQLIWMSKGYLEYRFSNSSFADNTVGRVVFSLELCAEYPGSKNDWPSDITVWINDREIGIIHSPGDYGDRHGRLTPSWWADYNTQYGDLWWISINEKECFLNEVRISDENLNTLRLSEGDSIRFRIGVKPDAQHCGGMNLFGHQFGDYPQDIVMSIYGY